MTYFEAESMRQEMIVAVEYREMVPEKYKKVAKKYTGAQWEECGMAILQHLEDKKLDVYKFLALVDAVRKGADV